MSIEAMTQALEALETIADEVFSPYDNELGEAITALRTAIAEAEKQEPVAWCVLEPWLSGKFEAQDCFSDVALDANVGWVPLYTTPPAAQKEPVAERLIHDYINALVANKPDEAAEVTKRMVDYVYTTPPAGEKK